LLVHQHLLSSLPNVKRCGWLIILWIALGRLAMHEQWVVKVKNFKW